MFGFFKKRKRLAGYLSGAEAYCRKNYIPDDTVYSLDPESVKEKEVMYSRKMSDSGDNKTKYSSRLNVPPQQTRTNRSTGWRYALSDEPAEEMQDRRDRYDSVVIDSEINRRLMSANVIELNDALERSRNQTFVERLTALIGVRDVRDSVIYKAAQIDRRLFSKMMSDSQYKPSKDTAVALALALQLPLTQANDLLSRAGYTFSHSDKRDIVIEYFFRERIYDLIDINIVLDKLGLKPIGR